MDIKLYEMLIGAGGFAAMVGLFILLWRVVVMPEISRAKADRQIAQETVDSLRVTSQTLLQTANTLQDTARNLEIVTTVTQQTAELVRGAIESAVAMRAPRQGD